VITALVVAPVVELIVVEGGCSGNGGRSGRGGNGGRSGDW